MAHQSGVAARVAKVARNEPTPAAIPIPAALPDRVVTEDIRPHLGRALLE
jgi:hypothetical protein